MFLPMMGPVAHGAQQSILDLVLHNAALAPDHLVRQMRTLPTWGLSRGHLPRSRRLKLRVLLKPLLEPPLLLCQ